MPSRDNSSPLKFAWLRFGVVALAHLGMRLVVLLPLGLQIKIGKRLGKLAWRLARSRRRVAARNIELCFPELSEAEREALVEKHFEAVGASIAETAMGWYGREAAIRRVVRIDGVRHLHEALARGNGVIFYSAHFTCIEFCFPALRPLCPRLTGMYKPQKNPVMTRIMNRARAKNVDELISSDNVRAMVRNLRRNAVVWYAADQSYGGKGSELIPFFSEPAMTNTAIWRIARSTGAVVLPYFFRRLPDDSGYVADIGAPLENFPTDDAAADVRRLTRRLEEYIRLCPEQYWWVHKRFKGRPEPYPDVYAAAG
ncbi:MAG TPA: lipid A biosynthesis acyltransferase [Gammaproteobacteria bacterium]|nr:lipid A biosynthesis acyltransferase [Gammaproteobacteria bacterium]